MPMSNCVHENFNVHAEVARIEKSETDKTIIAYHVDLKTWCRDCGKSFEWVGLPNGFSHYRPTVSIDGQIMHAPLIPAGGPQPPAGLAGFSVTHLEFPDQEPTKQ